MIDKWPDGGLTAFDIAARGSKMERTESMEGGSSGGRGRASAERQTPLRRRLKAETEEFISEGQHCEKWCCWQESPQLAANFGMLFLQF